MNVLHLNSISIQGNS